MKVFISHSSTDKKFVRTLKDGLIENGIQTWVDEDQMDLGDILNEKLNTALNESSHLVIILTPASVNSPWVKFELKKALENRRTGLMQKIIPIKYRECEIPEELIDLLYADLSEEVVLPNEDFTRIRFLTKGFDNVFPRIVRALKNITKAIDPNEKTEIIKALKSSGEQIRDDAKLIHRGNYQLNGYSTLESKLKYQEKIAKVSGSQTRVDDFRPILLPASLSKLFNPKLGDLFVITSNLNVKGFGHFAGFRVDDLKITMDKRSRDEVFLKNHLYYQVEINLEKKQINFFGDFRYHPSDVFSAFAGENNYVLAA